MTASRPGLTNRGRRGGAPDAPVDPVTPARVYTGVVPVLLEVLETSLREEDDPRVLCAAARSLGVAVDAPFDELAVEALLPLLAYDAYEDRDMVREAATFAIGLLGSGHAEVLLPLAWDTREGRALVDRREVPIDVRCAAVLALGVADDPGSVLSLVALLRELDDEDHEETRLMTSTVHALGMLQSSEAWRAGDALLELLGRRRLHPVVRAAIPTALGRLGRAEAVPPLLELAGDYWTEPLIRQSAAIGLGRLADMGGEVPEALREIVDEAKDGPLRHFAIMALARIGARDELPGRHAEQHAALQAWFAKRLTRPRRASDLPWLGLASGVYLRGQPTGRAVLAEPLLAAYRDNGGVNRRGAYTLALGLGGFVEAADEILADFRGAHDEGLRQPAALALGWLGQEQVADELLAELVDERRQTGFRDYALALRLLGDDRLADTVLGAYGRALDEKQRTTCAEAVAVLRVGSAIPPLDRAARHESLDAIGRGWALAAYERVVEPELIPWYARLRRDVNYMAHASDLSLTAMSGF